MTKLSVGNIFLYGSGKVVFIIFMRSLELKILFYHLNVGISVCV